MIEFAIAHPYLVTLIAIVGIIEIGSFFYNFLSLLSQILGNLKH